MNDVRQKFEAWADEYARQDKPATAPPKWIAWDAWRAAYEAGEIAMKEKAAQLANSCAQILPAEHRVGATWIGAQIHALPLSGAEKSKKEKA